MFFNYSQNDIYIFSLASTNNKVIISLIIVTGISIIETKITGITSINSIGSTRPVITGV